MDLGYSIGTDRGERFVSLDAYDHENVLKSMIFPSRNWRRFMKMLPDIDDCLMNNEFVEYKQISGCYYLNVTVCCNVIDIISVFGYIGDSASDITTNLIVSLVDWPGFMLKMELINDRFNDV